MSAQTIKKEKAHAAEAARAKALYKDDSIPTDWKVEVFMHLTKHGSITVDDGVALGIPPGKVRLVIEEIKAETFKGKHFDIRPVRWHLFGVCNGNANK